MPTTIYLQFKSKNSLRIEAIFSDIKLLDTKKQAQKITHINAKYAVSHNEIGFANLYIYENVLANKLIKVYNL